jgi:hypothetical protein
MNCNGKYKKTDKSNKVVAIVEQKYDKNTQKPSQDGPYVLMSSNPLNKLIQNSTSTNKNII